MGKNRNRGAYVEIINWDHACMVDFSVGRGFEITEPVVKRIQKRDQKTLGGIQSPKFCSDWSDDDAFAERYTCLCGEMRGKVFEGETCPYCNSKIEFRDVDLSITGWIKLKNYCVIHPIYYNMIADIIGKEEFAEIVTFNKKVTKNGILARQEDGKSEFAGIGIMEFKERFHEIMEYYRNKKKKKSDDIDAVLQDEAKVFPKAIPVYSSVLRPMSFQGDAFFYNPIDKHYNSIYISSRFLNNMEYYESRRKRWKKERKERMELSNILSSIQASLMELWKLIFEQVDQKDGVIKGDILGGMHNFSSRDVIIPDPSLKSDEIILNYMAFLELYRYEIIGCIVKMNGITENEAYTQWFYARIRYSEKIYEIMKYIIKKKKPTCIINRNPTINFWSHHTVMYAE